MMTTLVAHPVYMKIRRGRAGPAGGLWLLQCVGVLSWQCELVWEDDVCYQRNVQACRQLAQPGQKWRHADDIGRTADLRENRP